MPPPLHGRVVIQRQPLLFLSPASYTRRIQSLAGLHQRFVIFSSTFPSFVSQPGVPSPFRPHHQFFPILVSHRWKHLKLFTSDKTTTMSPISPELLKKQNAETSSGVIDLLADDSDFQKLSKYEGDLTVARDREDDEKLEKGIDFAKAKGVIDPDFKPEPYVQIDVLGKTPDQVADTIIETVDKNSDGGKVIVLVGLSGTGKGTTVAKLRSKLEQSGSGVVTWSNGNIFRSVTLLAATWCEQNNVDDISKALTKDNLQSFMGMLSFGKNGDGNYDTHIKGLGLDLWVSQVQNTDLKAPKVSKNIPTVAEATQVRLYFGFGISSLCLSECIH